jgi:two-component system, sensor histidine kinase
MQPMHKQPYRLLLTFAVISALLCALGSVAWVQWQQRAVLKETVAMRDDLLQASLQQVQVEFLRLRAAVYQQLSQSTINRKELQLRYDLFVSRAEIISTQRAMQFMGDSAGFRPMAQQVRQFIDQTDLFLGPEVEAPPSASQLQSMLAGMSELDLLLHGETVSLINRSAGALSLREERAVAHSQQGVWLTVLLSTLSLGSAALALVQLYRLDRRRSQLEALTRELATARDRADMANRAKTAFLANMSHEIRTPFQGLLGMLQVIDTSRLRPADVQRLAASQASAQHLLSILNDILDMAKLEAGAMRLHLQPESVREVVQEVAALMRNAASAKHLLLHDRVDEAVEDRLLLDSTRVRQVLFNLLSNAIKFTQQGEVGVNVTRDGNELVLSVTDSGMGMDEPTMAKLFQRFSQGDDSLARRYGGTGLGLEISRDLAHLMEGDISVSSQPGQGSRFELRLPYRVATATAHATQAQTTAHEGVPGATRRTLHVLAAEDNAVNRDVLAAMIDQLGHRVSFAADGREAVNAVRSQAFDLVLMDLHMPGVDGIEATQRIRALQGEHSQVPVIALTADAFADTEQRCVAAGMGGFLTKPVDMTRLKAVLDQHAAQGSVA